MNEGVLIALAAAYLVAPIALAIALAIQASRRRALEEEVRRLGVQVEALGRRVAAKPPVDATAASTPTATPTWPYPPTPAAAAEPVLDTSLPPPLLARQPAPPPPPPPPPTEPPVRIDWESLVGVRLFSWIAGVALLVAAVSFLRWSIENGWLGPAVRAAIGAACGLGLLVGAETRRARRYAVTAQSLAGAGVAILFSTVFAAHALWDLIPALLAFALLALVAAVAIAYAVRRESLTMALLGLAGGFLTPILVSTGQDRPVGLFSYLLLLDVGLAWVAHKKRWPLLGAVALAFTALYQAGWVVRFLDDLNVPVGVVVFLVFPAVGFAALALAQRDAPAGGPPPTLLRWTAALGALPPVLFLLRTASAHHLQAQWPLLLGFAVLLCAGLLVVAAVQGPEWLHLLGAAAATLAVLAMLSGGLAEVAWPGLLLPVAALAAVVLVGPGLLAARGRPLRAEGRSGAYAAPLLLGGLAAVPAWLPEGVEPLLLAGAVVGLAAASAARAVRDGDGRLLLSTGLLAPWGAVAISTVLPAQPLPPLAAAAFLGATGLAALLAARRRPADPPPSPWLVAGAAAFLVGSQLAVAVASEGGAAPAPALAALHLALLLGLLAVSARGAQPLVSLVAAVTTFAATSWYVFDHRHGPGGALLVAAAAWAAQVAVAWALLGRGARSRLPLWGALAATAGALLQAWSCLHRLDLPLLVGPAALAMALALVPHLLALRRAPGGLAAERSRVVVVAGGILALVTAAIPLQLENEWITLGLALLAPALAWLHGRVPHRGLLAWIGGLALAVLIRLAANPEVLGYHPRSGVPVWNFWLYAYGVPALALLAAARLLPAEDDRLKDGWPRLSPWLAAAGGLLLFLLLNVEIADAFSSGRSVHLRLGGSLAYDLALTIGWAVFAVALLAAGIGLRARPARVAAIALLAVTVLKGFLLDLGSLTGLYRVGSFVGLAFCLALVAVALQRFVLRDREERT